MPEPSAHFLLRIPVDIKTWIAEQSKRERMSMNSFIIRLVEKTKEGQHAAS